MTPIATSELKIKDGAADITVPVSIFAPQQSEHGDWACRYEIGWPQRTRVMNASGIVPAKAGTHTLPGKDFKSGFPLSRE